MLNWFQNAWHWTIEPLPLVLALAIYFGPVLYMRWKRNVYTPLYFLVPFLRVQSSVIDDYLGGNIFAPFIEDEDEAEKLRKKTRLTVNSSALLHILVIPALVAFLWSLFLSTTQFITALAILLASLAYQFFTSVLNFHYHTINAPKFKGWLVAFYIMVLFFISVAMLITRETVTPFLTAGNYILLIWSIAKWIFWIIISGVVISSVTTWVSSLLFDKNIRQKSLNERSSLDESKKIDTKTDVSTMPESRNQR